MSGQIESFVFNDEIVEIRKVVGSNGVVRIKESEVFAASMRETGIAGMTEAAVLLMNNLEARIFGGITIANNTTMISGTVVDKNGFKILVCLSENRIEATTKIGFDIINRDDK